MIAAVYARKSNDQAGAGDKSDSIERQIVHARAYATAKGWAVAEEHIYFDDGISGAEFGERRRPGLARLLNALRPSAPFNVLVMSEESRLGRESIEVAYAMKLLAQAGVRIFLYLEDRERTIDTPTEKLLLNVAAFADEMERERARQRTYDALERRAREGHAAGGVVFGYENRPVLAADQRSRLYVERDVHAAEAAVVRRIFEEAAAGNSQRRIALGLNADQAPTPLPRRPGRPRAWAASAVGEILDRDLYRGQIVWGRCRKRDRWGAKRYLARPEAQWVTREAPELRIVSDELWEAAHAAQARTRDANAPTATAPAARPAAPRAGASYLLSGLATCAVCGGGMVVKSYDMTPPRRVYRCGYNHQRGALVCANTIPAAMDLADQAVVAAFRTAVFEPDVIEAVVAGAVEALMPAADARDQEHARVLAHLGTLTAELDRLATAIAVGGDLPALVRTMKDREQRRAELETRLLMLSGRPTAPRRDRDHLATEVRTRLHDWRAMLLAGHAEARGVLAALLDGQRLRFTPRPELGVYEFSADPSLSGIVEARPRVTPSGYDRSWRFPLSGSFPLGRSARA